MKNFFNILLYLILKLFKKKFKIHFYKKDGFIQKKDFKKLKNFKVFIIKNGRIFTNSNEDAVYLKKNFVISNPSYQYRNSKNSNIKQNFIFRYGINKLKKKYNGRIVSIISGGAAKHNYGHWLFDSIFRLLAIRRIKGFKKFDYLYVPSFKHNYQKEIMNYLKIPFKKIISSEKKKYIEGLEVICTNHPFFHRFDRISKPIIDEIKNTFIKFKSLSNLKKHEKIFIERDYSAYNLKRDLLKYKEERILINNTEVKNYLSRIGFKSYKLKFLSFADQIKLFSNAKIIVSMFGAELSNLIFCKKGTKVIEIKNNKKLDEFKNISKICKLNHTQISIKPIYKSKAKQNGIIICEISRLKRLITDKKI